jgi:hypothetical protein
MLQPPGSIIELCHVVTDMDAALAHWIGVLGAGPFFVGEMRMEVGHRYRGTSSILAIRVAFGFSGGLLIELVQPLPDDRSVFAEVLAERGPGYHHVMLRDDYDSAHARLLEQGFAIALESTTPLGERCALFDTRALNGGFIEVMDLHIGFGQLTEAMAAAHEGFTGADPVRPLAPLFASVLGAH